MNIDLTTLYPMLQTPRKVVNIFCSASNTAGGNALIHQENLKQEVYKLSYNLSFNGHKVLFGGSNVGLMAMVGKGAYDANPENVIGVSPKVLETVAGEDNSPYVTLCTKNMSQRKKQESKITDVYVALVGGIGTMDELFEAITMKQLGIENKPIFVVDHSYRGEYSKALKQFLNSLVLLNTVKQRDVDAIQFISGLDATYEFMRHLEMELFTPYVSDIPEKHRG